MRVFNEKVFKGLIAVLMTVSVMATLSACESQPANQGDQGEDKPAEEQVEEAPKTSITLDKETYAAGESIKANYKIVDEVDGSAWIGIVPADTPHGSETDGDDADITYQKPQGKTDGEMTFNAPDEAGAYDIRLYSSDATGEELFSVGFTVEASEEAEEETTEETETDETDENDEPKMTLSKDSYIPGEAIEVTYTTPEGFDTSAWVGLIPSDIEHGKEEVNDNHDLEYRYLHGEVEGTLEFTAPTEPGSYDFRMNESDQTGAVEVASISFTVE